MKAYTRSILLLLFLQVGTGVAVSQTVTVSPVTGSPFCVGSSFNLNYTVSSSFGGGNTFTAELSDNTGSFSSPTIVGSTGSSTDGTITVTIPISSAASSAYQIRIRSNTPVTTSTNTQGLTITAPTGTEGTFGTTSWYVSCYNGSNFDSYYGFYTEDNLNFDSQARWNQGGSPSDANAASGSAYSGCIIPPDNHSYRYMRTNFACGYYQLDIPSHDDNITVLVNGSQVYQHNGCCDSHTNVWSGFLNASSTIELREQEGGGGSYLSFQMNPAQNPLIMSTPPTICAGGSTNLTVAVATPLTLNYTWSPATTPTTGNSVTATPATTTLYTVTGTDPVTSCSVSNTVLVTVASTFTTTVSPTNVTICASGASTTLTAGGANTYSWSPATGLNATTGSVVVASPTTTTTYTVTGSIGGCATTNDATVTVTVPSYPSTSTFGNNIWNAYVFSNTNYTGYIGFYTENNLSFNTATRWNSSNGPATADASSGDAYQGCAINPGSYTMSFKRTNFTCGYFQIDIPDHDDDVTVLVNGSQVFQHIGYGDAHTNVWEGFLGPTSQVEVRLLNGAGPGNLRVNVAPSANSPVTVNSPITICSGTLASLTASSAIAGATFNWTPTTDLSSPSSASTLAGPINADITYTVHVTDAAGSGCSATASVPITVGSPNIVVSPTSATLTCPGVGVTLTASGAASYSWTPTTGLTPASGLGNTVVANPTVTTTYTVTGSNNCSFDSKTVTVTVNFADPASFPSSTWNAYCYNTIGFTGYQGYYTENGSGTSGYDFDTRTRWADGGAPSTANAVNGNAYVGCTMPNSNISLSFKRTNFACGIYRIDVSSHDDDFYIIINGVQVAAHNGCCDAHTNLWTGALNASSQVELRMQQGGGGSNLAVQFVPVAQPAGQSTWMGGTSSDWFTASNWCGPVPTSSIDAFIPSAGPQNMPVISGAGAVVRNITIDAAIPAAGYSAGIAAATLTTSGTSDLAVFGNWTNNGGFTPNTGSVTFSGSTSTTINSLNTQAFYNIIFNKTALTTNNSNLQVTNQATFTSGIVAQSNIFEFTSAASASGASNSSYIDGLVRKTGVSTFAFPVGNNNLYHPLTIGPAGGTNTFEARYINSNPNPLYNVTSKDASINHVSVLEYWQLARVSGASNVTVNLAWAANSVVTVPGELVVAGWDGSVWRDRGNGGIVGSSVTSGSVVGLFGPFTLGSSTANNPLPITLSSFNAVYNSGEVVLHWKTESEINNDFFTVQRAVTTEHFEDVVKVAGFGVGATAIPHSYTAIDYQPVSGQSYYRLKQTDIDKKVSYSKLVSVNINDASGWVVYPNPSNGTSFSINFSPTDFKKKAVIKLQDISGNELLQSEIENLSSVDTKIELFRKLSAGVYIISVMIDGKVGRQKIVVR